MNPLLSVQQNGKGSRFDGRQEPWLWSVTFLDSPELRHSAGG
jgi:hypothetical protein